MGTLATTTGKLFLILLLVVKGKMKPEMSFRTEQFLGRRPTYS